MDFEKMNIKSFGKEILYKVGLYAGKVCNIIEKGYKDGKENKKQKRKVKRNDNFNDFII